MHPAFAPSFSAARWKCHSRASKMRSSATAPSLQGWARTDEPIKPYTTVETMECGWCWQIEHEHWINRGYVFSSSFISDDAARQELLRKNPRISNEPRFVPFRPGRREKMWVGNVVGVGNSSGFVEPLEATSLATIVTQARALASTLMIATANPLRV
jgi:tryptophan halogenase